MQEQRDEGEVSMCAENDGHLPLYTVGEWSRELRQRSVLLRWRAQRHVPSSLTQERLSGLQCRAL